MKLALDQNFPVTLMELRAHETATPPVGQVGEPPESRVSSSSRSPEAKGAPRRKSSTHSRGGAPGWLTSRCPPGYGRLRLASASPRATMSAGVSGHGLASSSSAASHTSTTTQPEESITGRTTRPRQPAWTGRHSSSRPGWRPWRSVTQHGFTGDAGGGSPWMRSARVLRSPLRLFAPAMRQCDTPSNACLSS